MSRASARTGLADQLLVAWVRSGKHRFLGMTATDREHAARSAYDLAEAFCVEAERRAEHPRRPPCPACAEPRPHHHLVRLNGDVDVVFEDGKS
jgi:hypothetical protein